MQLAGKLLIAGMLSLALAAPALAQNGFQGQGRAPVFQVNPYLQQAAVNQALVNQAVLNQAAARNAVAAQLGLGAAAALSSTPAGPVPALPSYSYPVPVVPPTYGHGYDNGGGGGGSYPSFYPPPYYIGSPAGDYLRGVADLTVSYGKYIQDYQRARLLNQEVERSKLVTRRQIIDEWRYMQSLIPTSEDIRRLDWERDLARARKQAPIGDILSGKSLNVLLTQLKQTHGKGSRGPAIPLDEEALRQINVAPAHGKNIGFIKSGKIHWPMALQDQRFTKLRENIDRDLKDAIDRARINGKVDAALMNDLVAARREMDDLLDKIGGDLTMSQYMEAKRYIGYLTEGIRTLGEPDVQNYFNRKYEARGKTVPDLIDYMNKEGLVFVNSIPGVEAPYRTLYTFLAAYEDAVASGMINR